MITAMVITAFTFITATAATAQEPAVMALLRKNYGGARTVSASFDLAVYWDVREREEKKSGELVIASGERFRVTLGKDVFVSDGKTYWQYSERNAQVVMRNHSDIDAATLPSKILSSFLSGREFAASRSGDGTTQLTWTGSASADDGYKEIRATVNEKAGTISVLKMKDGNDNVHTYTFKKTEFDKAPKDDAFRFKAPRGVETLDLRESK
jgi:outer membrane lipoprotein-sorting protein